MVNIAFLKHVWVLVVGKGTQMQFYPTEYNI